MRTLQLRGTPLPRTSVNKIAACPSVSWAELIDACLGAQAPGSEEGEEQAGQDVPGEGEGEKVERHLGRPLGALFEGHVAAFPPSVAQFLAVRAQLLPKQERRTGRRRHHRRAAKE